MHFWKTMFLQTCWGCWETQQKVRERWCERISCIIEGVYTIGLCFSRFLSEKIYSTWKGENWDQDTPSDSPRAPGTKFKFGKERLHREELSKSVRLMSVVLARQKSGERSHEETLPQERCARRVAWDLAKPVCKPKNADKATFSTPNEAKGNPLRTVHRSDNS